MNIKIQLHFLSKYCNCTGTAGKTDGFLMVHDIKNVMAVWSVGFFSHIFNVNKINIYNIYIH